MKIINISTFLLGAVYPFIIYFFNQDLWLFFLIFSLLWLIKFILLSNIENNKIMDNKNMNEFVKIFQSYSYFLNNRYMSFLLFILFFVMFIIKFMNIQYELLMYMYPVVIYITFFAVFINNIKERPLIESFATLEHKIRGLQPLSEKEKNTLNS